jgi:hypothetical protein
MGGRQLPQAGNAAEEEYVRKRNALIAHLAGAHRLIGYDPFPIGTRHDHPMDCFGNVLVHNRDLDRLLALHDEEGRHGRSTHQHESPAEQERLGRYVSPERWRPAAGHAGSAATVAEASTSTRVSRNKPVTRAAAPKTSR